MKANNGTRLISAAEDRKAYLESRDERLKNISTEPQKTDYSTSIGVSVILGIAAGFIIYVLGKCFGFSDPSPIALVITSLVSAMIGHHEGKQKVS